MRLGDSYGSVSTKFSLKRSVKGKTGNNNNQSGSFFNMSHQSK